MRCARPIIAANTALFGRKGAGLAQAQKSSLSGDDLRLFVTTFAAGFAFVSLMIA